jgi:hypothetical protein
MKLIPLKRTAGKSRLYVRCCGCESLLRAKVAICPNCHAYRFDAALTNEAPTV